VSTTRYFAEGSLIADSRELASGLMVISSGKVTLGTLNFDDSCARISQTTGAIGRCNGLLKSDDQDAL
jgi:hypothetical protein